MQLRYLVRGMEREPRDTLGLTVCWEKKGRFAMAKFKEALVDNPGNFLSKRYKGCGNVNVDDIISEIMEQIPDAVRRDYGLK